MNLAIIMKYKGEEYALAKTTTVERLQSPRYLVEGYLNTLLPGAEYWISTDIVMNGEVSIHPERNKIMNMLREIALHQPQREMEIEVEYERI